ncbi:signal transduction histidine kinase [Acidovorax delafieldii]|uniref:Virulence sensor protein BvgS n=2 Tax=Acidovorax delafieldii TaxID=47920 RepID=A0AAJ2C1J9_ACIDE|nr:ATP-binding protein [Acidovorax delafieldii]MDR6768342.1 signal transduction histidine kinase [Acidovorax delafieldii]MDR6837628.1 signal transduction histidine kinase [Acidovorax delafieldii]MDR7367118.1 signal transduction histidine kinase [Acidovorax delafieldii]
MTAPASPPANNPALHPPTAHLAQSKPPHSSLPLRTMVVLGTALVLLLAWATVAILLNVSWRDAMNAQIRQNSNLALSLGEQTVRVMAAVDQATIRMRDAVLAGDFDKADFTRFANETGLAPDILTQLSLVGPDGRFVGSNIDPTGEKTGHVDLSEREHVQVHLTRTATEAARLQMTPSGLFVGKPVVGKVSGKATIQLSRSISYGTSSKAGLVVASVNPGYFEDVYRDVQLGKTGIVTLVGNDRAVRARVMGGQSIGIGEVVARAANNNAEELGANGHYIRASGLDGIERIYAYSRVGNYPLLLVVATSTDEALSGWRGNRNVALFTMALFSVALVGAAVIFLRSVHKLESTNAALRISEAEARSASQAKSEFLAAVSHELRTPLTSIRGFAELMEMRLDQPRFKEQASLIRKAAEHLNALLTEILDLAKVEAGAMPHLPTEQNVAEIVQSTADFFAVTAANKNLALHVRIAPDAPHTLMCDGLRLKQVLNNLLSNAMKFTDIGSVAIEVDASPDAVRFHVVDTGPGIPAHLHETIFEKFRQGNDQVSYQHGGTGLGLALSRALAVLMGGTLTLSSSEGQGSRFTLTLPREPGMGSH